jgi:hypothetical protein
LVAAKALHPVTTAIFPFPLYHGTSSHYLGSLIAGQTVPEWDLRHAALDLLRDAWAALEERGVSPDWSHRAVLNQESLGANWQHDSLYVSPSKLTAVRYAVSNADYGGELLTLCRYSIDQLIELDSSCAAGLSSRYRNLEDLLKGGGKPLLIEFRDVPRKSLVPEVGNRTVQWAIDLLESKDPIMREALGQQINFRLSLEASVIHNISWIVLEDEGDPSGPYQLRHVG